MAAHPGLRDQLFTPDGELNRFVNVYLDGQDVRYLGGTATPVDAHDEIGHPAGDGRGRVSAYPRGAATSSRRSGTRRSSRSPGCRPSPSVRLFAKLEMANPTGR